MPSVESVQQQLIPQLTSLFLERLRQIYRNIIPERPRASLLSNKSALQAFVFIASPRRHDLRTIHLERLRVEFPLPVHHSAQHRQPPHVAVVQDFDDLRALVAEAEIRFIKDHGPSTCIKGVEYRRDGRCSAGKEWLVARRSHGDQHAALARTHTTP